MENAKELSNDELKEVQGGVDFLIKDGENYKSNQMGNGLNDLGKFNVQKSRGLSEEDLESAS